MNDRPPFPGQAPPPSCWDCAFQDLRAAQDTTFLGMCTWFPLHGKGPAKPIPSDVVDKGCKFFQRRQYEPETHR